MAIVQMQRINICALKKNRKAILERLQELGAMEIDIQLEDDNLGEKQDVASSRALFSCMFYFQAALPFVCFTKNSSAASALPIP